MEENGDSFIHANFFSCSTSKKIADEFSGTGISSRVYNIIVDKGIPFVKMDSTSQYKREKEYLLPRNIKITLIDKSKNLIQISQAKPLQFNRYTGCKEFEILSV